MEKKKFWFLHVVAVVYSEQPFLTSEDVVLFLHSKKMNARAQTPAATIYSIMAVL